ncbi:DUF2512 family protein [Bacillus sp. M6-12]|uniref:DUF2512 family protein n=1 Tax=Bacillus sp. M6-12 TaxID=2054166 RepID=UPI0015E09CC5|nr:DUF2512 family protein [Bacillus sp. M6-12]
MEHLRYFIIKTIVSFSSVLLILLLLTKFSVIEISSLALIYSIVGYLLIDILIIPRIGEMIAVPFNFFTSFLVFGIGLDTLGLNKIIVPCLIISLLLSGNEYLFYIWYGQSRQSAIRQKRVVLLHSKSKAVLFSITS